MKHNSPGWVIINIGHPATGSKYVVPETFSHKRSDAVKRFVAGSDNTWEYWRKKFNFRVVRADIQITCYEK